MPRKPNAELTPAPKRARPGYTAEARLAEAAVQAREKMAAARAPAGGLPQVLEALEQMQAEIDALRQLLRFRGV